MKSEGSGNATCLKFEILVVLNLVLVVQSEDLYFCVSSYNVSKQMC